MSFGPGKPAKLAKAGQIRQAQTMAGLHHHQNRPARGGGAADLVAAGARSTPQQAMLGETATRRSTRWSATTSPRARRHRAPARVLLRLRPQGADGAPARRASPQWRADPAQGFRHRHALLALPEADHCGGARACLAGACELALACDITIAAEDAFFGEPELKFGAGIVAMILPWIVGPKIAKEIILHRRGPHPGGACARDRHGQPRRAGRTELDDDRAARSPATSPRSIPTWSRRPSARSTAPFEAQGMLAALEEALAIDLAIEGEGSPDKVAVHGNRPPRRSQGRARLARRPLSGAQASA